MQKVKIVRFFSARELVMLGAGILLVVVLLLLTSGGSEAATITVDDDGPADYSKIQDAINASIDGDTVFVYNGTYYENVWINKMINLTGENKDTTTIDGGGNWNVVQIVRDWVNISGFTLKNSGGYPIECAGVRIYTDYNNISGNVMVSNKNGIFLDMWAKNNIISGNQISNNYHGIWLNDSENNKILDNYVFSNDGGGITLFSYSSYNNVSGNSIIWGGYGYLSVFLIQ